VAPVRAQTPQAPLVITKQGANWKISWLTQLGRTYFVQSSTDLVHWEYANYIDYGDGSSVPLWFLTTANAGVHHYYRLKYSDSTSQDYDGDGLSNDDEIDVHHTDPFNPDTDGDTIGDGAEVNASLNPTQPDDASPGIYVLAWQRLEDAQLSPVGWSSQIRDSSNNPTAPLPNAYRKLGADAVMEKSSALAGHEYNNGKTMTVQRTLLPPTAFPGEIPTYRETVTYHHTTGLPFVSIGAHKNPANWGYTAEGPIATRNQYPGNNSPNYDYTWKYAPTGGNTLTGDYHSAGVMLPVDTTGTQQTWVDAPVAQGGNRFTTGSATITFPNEAWPPYGDIIGEPGPNGTQNWTSATVCKTEESSGVKTTWTLANRWTYSDLRAEMETLRPNINVIDERSGPGVDLPVYPMYFQSAAGSIIQGSYQFRFERQPGGGHGPTALLWPETFTPLDNPDTPGVNESGPPQTRLRVVILPPNAAQSPIYTLDHRTAPFTVLPESATAPKADGETKVGGLVPSGLAVDYNRDGQINESDRVDYPIEDQGAYDPSSGPPSGWPFRQTGALIFVNYSKDEDRVSGGKPVGDAIRYYHDGWNPSFTDEDYQIRTGEDKLPPDAGTSERSNTNYVRTHLKHPDIYPLEIRKLGELPANYRVFLKVGQADEKKAFHLYRKIAVGQQAIWGGGMDSASPPPSAGYSAADEVDITRWINPAAPDYEETREDLRNENGDLVTALDARNYTFGIEGILYKGQETGSFQQPAQFKGYADLRLEIRTANGQLRAPAGQVRVTFVRKPAFPGAYGYGRWALGGSRGETFTVDSLVDSTTGPSTVNGLRLLNGTLRQALDYRNYDHNGRLIPRTVVFRKSGTLPLTEDLKVANSSTALRGLLTIAGQSAPIGGVLLKNAGLYVNGQSTFQSNPNLYKRANDVVLRYLRVRPYATGAGFDSNPDKRLEPQDDAIRVSDASDVILDHLSASWARDGSLEIHGSDSVLKTNPDQAVTAQWNLVAESLLWHARASIYTGKWGSRYTCHHNFYANHEERMPELGNWKKAVEASPGDREGVITDVRNNVFYNWGGDDSGHSTENGAAAEMRFNFIQNFFKRGPDSNQSIAFREQNGNCRAFFSNNRWSGQLWSSYDEYWTQDLKGRALRSDYWQSAAFRTEYVFTDIAPLSDYNWKNVVLEKAGDSRWRDAVDRRNAAAVDAGKGKIFDQITSGRDYALLNFGQSTADYTTDAYPVIPVGDWGAAYDADNDGMRDAWEGSSPQNIKPWDDLDGDGFTNLEEFLNRTSPITGDDPMDETAEPHLNGPL